MNYQSSIPQSLVSLNLKVRSVSQITGVIGFAEMEGQTAAVDGTK
jgi:hypothetical protein